MLCHPKYIYITPAAFLTQTVALDDATVKFEIWDTAGQERYRSLAPMYYRGAAAAIIVYDITNPDSFAGAKSWVKELQRRGDQNVVIAMVSEISRTVWYYIMGRVYVGGGLLFLIIYLIFYTLLLVHQ